MKKALINILSSVIIIGYDVCFAKNHSELVSTILGNGSISRVLTPAPVNIDIYDTVVFDISQADISGNSVQFPVYFLTTDVINALDFSLRYNEVDFLYDTTININPNLQSNSFYNSNDSTIRYTSFSLTSIPNSTPQVLVKFTMLSGAQLCLSDVNTLRGYLNGDECSIKVIDCQPSGVYEISNSESLSVEVHPNPASDILNVHVNQDATIEILNTEGEQIFSQFSDERENRIIDTGNFADGIYLMKVYTAKFITVKKIVVSK